MSIVTDSTPVEDPKDPETCTVFLLYRLFATPDELAEMERRFRAGGYGYGEAKKELLAKIEEKFGPHRERKKELLERLPERCREPSEPEPGELGGKCSADETCNGELVCDPETTRCMETDAEASEPGVEPSDEQ